MILPQFEHLQANSYEQLESCDERLRQMKVTYRGSLLDAMEIHDSSDFEDSCEALENIISDLKERLQKLKKQILKTSDTIESQRPKKKTPTRSQSGKMQTSTTKKEHMIREKEALEETIVSAKSSLHVLIELQREAENRLKESREMISRIDGIRGVVADLLVIKRYEHEYLWRNDLLDELDYEIDHQTRLALQKMSDEAFQAVVDQVIQDPVRLSLATKLSKKMSDDELLRLLTANPGEEILETLLKQSEITTAMVTVVTWVIDDAEKLLQIAQLSEDETGESGEKNALRGRHILYISGGKPSICQSIVEALEGAGAIVTHREPSAVNQLTLTKYLVVAHMGACSHPDIDRIKSMVPSDMRVLLPLKIRQSSVVDFVNQKLKLFRELSQG